MSAWSKEELKNMRMADDLHISPFRDDGITYGTPTWVWSVVVDGELFVRAYHGQDSRWYRAALPQKGGGITVAGMMREVTFEPCGGHLNDLVDEAYRDKYKGSPYLSAMIGQRARMATIKVILRAGMDTREPTTLSGQP